MQLRIADLDIDVPYSLMEDARWHCQAYQPAVTPQRADITVQNDIRELGEQLPLFGRMIVHGVALGKDSEEAFIFTAPSGTGKSTHALLWQRLLGEERVQVINGDKPIVRLMEGGTTFQVYGSPWCGKEGLHLPIGMPLRGIVMLHRLDEAHPSPEILPLNRPLAPGQGTDREAAFLDFMTEQVFLPRSVEPLKQTLRMIETLYRQVPIYQLYADMSRECAELSVRTLTEHDNK